MMLGLGVRVIDFMCVHACVSVFHKYWLHLLRRLLSFFVPLAKGVAIRFALNNEM